MRRRAYFAAAWLTISAPAAAQVAEVGVGISRACVGSEGSVCGDDIGPMWSTHASLWLDDRLEIGLRLAALSLSDITVFVFRDDRFNGAQDPAIRTLPGIDLMLRNAAVASSAQKRSIISPAAAPCAVSSA